MAQDFKEIEDPATMVCIIGDSLLMDGVAACLEERSSTTLVRLDTPPGELNLGHPGNQNRLIIFELDSPASDALLDLLYVCPGVQLVGIDRTGDQVLILNNMQKAAHTMDELFQIINQVAVSGD